MRKLGVFLHPNSWQGVVTAPGTWVLREQGALLNEKDGKAKGFRASQTERELWIYGGVV